MTAEPRPPPDDGPSAAHTALKAADHAVGPLPLDDRRALLDRLARETAARAEAFAAAVSEDFGLRSRAETLVADVLASVLALRQARARLRHWARARPISTFGPFWPARARLVPQPLGVVGILSPWNYPVQLALIPVAGALAAGNRVALKPSEAVPRTAELLADLIHHALGPTVARTVLGGPEIATEFCRQPWDHLFFTGSTDIGRSVLRAAAENLVPTTLELGGKCPAVVLPGADLDRAAEAIVRGKALNAGQTCLAPDTVLLVGIDRFDLAAALDRVVRRFFPEGLETQLCGPRQRARFASLRSDLVPDGLVPIGDDPPPGRLRLWLASDAGDGSPFDRHEVFGPVLPVVQVPDLDAAIGWITDRPHPLAIYLFGGCRGDEAELMRRTRSGALVLDGTVDYAGIETLPFGGVGASGFGRYHGEAGFLAFSNMRAQVRMARWSVSRLFDPPWGRRAEQVIRRLLRA